MGLKKRVISIALALFMVIAGVWSVPAASRAADAVTVSYCTHVQRVGWQEWQQNGAMSGTQGQSLRLEGIKIALNKPTSELGIIYTTHCQNYGWLPWSANGEMNGTEGEAKRLEAIKIRLTGSQADLYDVYYRVHAQRYGWLNWAKNGEAAGTAGMSLRLEGIQILVLEKGMEPGAEVSGITNGNAEAYAYTTGDSVVNVPGENSTNILYRTHVQQDGWQGWKYNGAMAGTQGRSLRLEGIYVALSNQQYGGGVMYRTHVQRIGWQEWRNAGEMSGTSGQSLRLEAIQIFLTGDMAKHYDVYYRVHAQTFGWLGWSKNGEPSGTAGFSKRLEGIQVVLMEKNAAAPGDVGGVASARGEGFVKTDASEMPENPYVEPAADASGNSGGNGNNNGGSGNNNGGSGNNNGGGNTEKDAQGYTYEIIPLLAPFNEYFYIKTDNPDPDSFWFVDKNTVYSDNGGSIEPLQTKFRDVLYENEETLRVKGGYLASGSYTDGGDLVLQERVVTDTIPVYNLTTGETTYSKEYDTRETNYTVRVEPLVDEVDYLIRTYSGGQTEFFARLSSIQSGFDGICLYSGVYVLGKLVKSTYNPYWGLSTSPHVDQDIYIQDPYGREDNESLFISALYPFRYDSMGFPSMMGSVAKRLDSSATTAWNANVHYMIDVTYNGETKSYGGAGSGGGQGILASQLAHQYTFDKSASDASTRINLDDLRATICSYGALEIPDEKEDILTFEDVRKKVGAGSYVRLLLLTSIFGGSDIGYTFLYDNGSTSNGWGLQAAGAIGYFTNAWFEGRYYNKWEFWYPGAELEDTVKNVQPSLVFKDVTLKYPNDGKDYRYSYTKIGNLSNYNTTTGKWSGYMRYRYKEELNAWVADVLLNSQYYDSASRKTVNLYDADTSTFAAGLSQDFIDACVITLDEAKAMKLDCNTNTEPKNFLIYDKNSAPGTPGTSGDN